KQDVKTAVDKLNEFNDLVYTNVKFVMHDELEKYYVKVVDVKTDEVIREIHPEKMHDIYAQIEDYMVLLVYENVYEGLHIMNINTGNAMRVGGLAYGIDTEEIVSQLMEAERAPLIKLEQDQQRISWKTDAFRDINTQLKELDDIVNEMKYSKSYKSKSTSTSDDGAVTASAN